MTEYMTMKQAFECKDADIPFIEDRFNHRTKANKAKLFQPGCVQSPSTLDALSDKWQVIKTEPKVLTVKEMIISSGPYVVDDERLSIDECELHDLAEKAEKNGQLKEWNRTKEFRNTIKDVLRHQPKYPINRIDEALENLKPPYQQ